MDNGRTRVRRKLLQWELNNTHTLSSVPLNLKEVIYCTSIREGSDMEWNYAYRKYLDTNLPSEKKVLLKALGCATKPWLLSK